MEMVHYRDEDYVEKHNEDHDDYKDVPVYMQKDISELILKTLSYLIY